MQDVRAFKPEAPKLESVVIDERALSRIKDIAQAIWNERKSLHSQHQLMFLALHQYMSEMGAKVNFEVRL